MNGQEAVLDLFGHLTITEIFVWIAAIYYLLSKYKEIYAWLKKWFRKTESNSEALNNAKKLGTFHEQSIEIRTEMQRDIDSIKESIELIMQRMDEMQEKSRKKEVNRLRNTLISAHQYYTSPAKNPMQTWTKMESEAFWALFHDYEDGGGDGYMHSDVEPDMTMLTVIDMTEAEKISELMNSRR